MKKVVSISLNGNAFQLEESGYEELRVYLERAEARLKDSPDRAEVMADLEQAIGEKCTRVTGPHKTVVSSSEISNILAEMGPVESADDKPADAPADAGFTGAAAASAASGTQPRKRLFKIREGQMWAGVCNGIAAYLGLDVTWVRIAVVVLTLITTGFTLLAYFALAVIVPYADTSEDRAAAFGAPFSTEEFIGRAKKKPEGSREYDRWRREWRRQQRHWQRQWDHMNAQVRQATAQMGPQTSRGRSAIFAVLVPVAAIMGAALFVVFILSLLSLIAQHTVFGWGLPHHVPMWVAVIALIVLYSLATTIVRAFRHGGGYSGRYHPGWAALHTILWIGCALLLFWAAYMFFPGVREVIDQLTWAANLTLENLSATIV
jgi:phage shock protein PspC (stress-responsive transcriptional regulator)